MGLIKLISNNISLKWKEAFNKNVDYLNSLEKKLSDQDKSTNSRIDNLVLHSGGDSPNEVVDARVNNKGEIFDTLYGRLLEHENLSDDQLAILSQETQDQKEQLSQLNESVKKFAGGYTEDIDVYVSKDGNDKTGNGTEEAPFLTIQTAINSLPLIIVSGVTIWIDDGVYLEDINITGFSLRAMIIRPKNNISSIDIAKSDLPVKIRSLSVYSCSGYIRLEGLQIVDTANAPIFEGRQYGVVIDQSGYMALNKCKFSERTIGQSYNALYVGGTSKMNMYGDTRFDNQEIAVRVRLLAEGLVSPAGSGNKVGALVENATIRGNPTTSFASTPIQISGNGLAITKGTVLS